MRAIKYNPPFLRASAAAALLFGFVVVSPAQRSATLRLDSTNGSRIQITWRSGSIVPSPGLQIFPGYQVHRSADLQSWTPIGERFAGGIGGTNKAFSFVDGDTGQELGFYRLESIVELPNADLIGENLAQGDFSGGNLFGADLFDANLHDAILRNTDLGGADLGFAVVTNADLSGANLFAAKMLGADLSFAEAKGADVSFADLDSATLFAAGLRQADLRFTVLSGADLRFASLHAARLDEHTLIDSKWRTIWEIVSQGAAGRNLQRADLSLADISEADLNRADLRFADLTAAVAIQSDFSGANLAGAILRFIDLRGAKFDTNV